MPRKKRTDAAEAVPTPEANAATAMIEAPTPATSAPAAETNDPSPTPPTDGTGKNYGPPYKAIFSSQDKGFELGENRRFKQRVFTFKDRPTDDVIAALKDAGFTYRAAEKAWTTPATAESRVLTDRLARQFAGPDASMSRP